MEQQQQLVQRLQRIFEVFLQENFATTNNVYFEKLITHLSAKENLYVLQSPFAIEWVDKCISILTDDFGKINPKVTSFMLNFSSLMIQNEWVMIMLRERHLMDRILFIIKTNSTRFSPSIKLGCIRLMSAVSKYSLGMAYISNRKCWDYLIELCNRDHTLYVVREARQLLYELLYTFSVKAKDETAVLEILNEIIKPLQDNVFKDGHESIMVNVDDTGFQYKMASTLDLLTYIFEQTLESEEKANIAHLCQIYHNLEINIWKLTEMTQNSSFFNKIIHALASLNFAILVQDQWDEGQIAPEKFSRFGLSFFNSMTFCLQRHQLLNFIKLAELYHVLWKKLGKRAPPEILIETHSVKFENQLITLQLLPVLFILRSHNLQKEELFENYIMKLLEISCEHTMRICYRFRDTIIPSQNTAIVTVADLAYKAIHGILSMQNILEREQAILVFQAMIYALKEFISEVDGEKSNANYNQLPKNCKRWISMEFMVTIPNVLNAILTGLHTLIKRYHISWKESIETTCVVNMVAVILENPNLTEASTVQALKLVQLSIEHFLSPNMALLVDNLQGSGLVCLGPIIVKRFHDTAWEVRDSTLELTISIANISRIKFPAFQNFLYDYKMCPIIMQMAKNDQEAYVRASALKCLSKMVLINIIWDNVLSNNDLIEHLFHTLIHESEGIVRKEAIKALATIYEHRKIPSEYRETLYSTLVHCVISDLHWEVKVEALRFWELEFKKQFTDQGMIDGTFPTVTFSKEYKKIVTLNEKEIKLRIMKVFQKLSQRGCLGVILKCLKEDCDLEVLKTAVCLVHNLLEQLKKYNFESLVEELKEASSSTSSSNAASTTSTPIASPVNELVIDNDPFTMTDNNNMLYISPPSTSLQAETPTTILKEKQDEAIDYILESQDINILVAQYEQKMILMKDNASLDGETSLPPIDTNLYKSYTSVDIKEFMQTIQSLDLNSLLKNHNEWLLGSESFISLLDDIIVAIKCEDDSLFADCY
ncbi:integrator complex assembly factor Brat1 [Haematobia irritans]|uniref:integrator complex assembly factor Brat1 n=1 Tax=Haematobia irritans TaxID=7368 RepID=UPI003F4FD0A2